MKSAHRAELKIIYNVSEGERIHRLERGRNTSAQVWPEYEVRVQTKNTVGIVGPPTPDFHGETEDYPRLNTLVQSKLAPRLTTKYSGVPFNAKCQIWIRNSGKLI